MCLTHSIFPESLETYMIKPNATMQNPKHQVVTSTIQHIKHEQCHCEILVRQICAATVNVSKMVFPKQVVDMS